MIFETTRESMVHIEEAGVTLRLGGVLQLRDTDRFIEVLEAIRREFDNKCKREFEAKQQARISDRASGLGEDHL